MEWFFCIAGDQSSVLGPNSFSIENFSRRLSHRYFLEITFVLFFSLLYLYGFVPLYRDEAVCFFC